MPNWQAIEDAHAPGDEVEIVYDARRRQVTGRVRFAADPRLEVVPYEDAGVALTAEMRAFRESWLGSPR